MIILQKLNISLSFSQYVTNFDLTLGLHCLIDCRYFRTSMDIPPTAVAVVVGQMVPDTVSGSTPSDTRARAWR